LKSQSTSGTNDPSPEEDLAYKVAVLEKSPGLGHLHDSTLKEIAVCATTCRFRKGEAIFHEGDPCNFFYVIVEGRVKCFKESPSGKQFITFVANRYETLNAVVLFGSNPHFLSAKAMENTTLLRVEREPYVSWAQRHPSHVLRIVTMMGKALGAAYDSLIDVVGERVEQRVCHVLDMLCGKFGAALNFTCGEIAELSGTTTETVIRVLSKLKTSKVLSSTRGKIHVLDQAELKRLSRVLKTF
jgi:CRP-like cAMP-binding protein